MTSEITADSFEGAVHQYMPAMTPGDYEALRNSIRDFGYDGPPVVLDENGHILDGHHRARACAELGITPPTVVRDGLDDDGKWDYVWHANMLRRHLTLEQKRDLIRMKLARYPETSNRELSRDLSVSHNTVQKERAEMELSGQIDQTLRPHQRMDQGADEPRAENHADHRQEVWVKVQIGYPAPTDPSQGIHMRNGLPYPRESRRKVWETEEIVVSGAALESIADMYAVVNQGWQTATRQVMNGELPPPLTVELRTNARA